MTGMCKIEDRGKTQKCKLCGKEFTMECTFVYCPKCSFIINSRNYCLLTSVDKKLANQHRYKSCVRNWAKCHHDMTVASNKRWRSKNISKWRIQRNRAKIRYNEETVILADNNRTRWTHSEIAYLESFGKLKTAREIAIDLGRTYNAIMSRACAEHVSLMTNDKRHGKLVTREE